MVNGFMLYTMLRSLGYSADESAMFYLMHLETRTTTDELLALRDLAKEKHDEGLMRTLAREHYNPKF